MVLIEVLPQFLTNKYLQFEPNSEKGKRKERKKNTPKNPSYVCLWQTMKNERESERGERERDASFQSKLPSSKIFSNTRFCRNFSPTKDPFFKKTAGYPNGAFTLFFFPSSFLLSTP